jgi:MtN3 and saliva related transmembrane protein
VNAADPSSVPRELDMTDLLAAAAAGWGILMAVSPLLQIRRIVRRRSAADVSIGYLLVLQVGFGLWVAYGPALGNAVLVLPNSLAMLVGTVAVATAWRYRDRAPSGIRA